MGTYSAAPIGSDDAEEVAEGEAKRFFKAALAAAKRPSSRDTLAAVAYLELMRRIEYVPVTRDALDDLETKILQRFDREEAADWRDPDARRRAIKTLFAALRARCSDRPMPPPDKNGVHRNPSRRSPPCL